MRLIDGFLMRHIEESQPDRIFTNAPSRRRTVVGAVTILALSACSMVPNPYRTEDEAVAQALSSEPMWVTYRPGWVTKESSHLGWRSPGVIESERVMQNFRLLYGAVPPGAVSEAKAASVQAGWNIPGANDFLQLKRAQGSGRIVTLRLSITATDTALGISIDGSFA